MPAKSNSPVKSTSRHFLGWSQPILSSACELLAKQYQKGNVWDLRKVLIALPSGLAARRLGEMLALKSQADRLILHPPQIVTVGNLPEELYVAKLPFASDLVQNLAWVRALQQTSLDELKLVVPQPPPKTATQQWLELGKILSNLHRELASDKLDFSQVQSLLGSSHPEYPRWHALAEIQGHYLEELDRLSYWDIQTARLCALRFNECSTSKQIILVGCVDLNRTQRSFVDSIREQVEVWIGAPESESALFDLHGCLNSEAWNAYQSDVPSSALLVGNSPTDQAELLASTLADLGSEFHQRELTIGVPDASLLPELRHRLDLAGVDTRYGPGEALNRSEPVMLLQQIGRYIEDRSYPAFAALVRHPAVNNYFRVHKVDLPTDWLAQIDDYYAEVLPKTVGDFVYEKAPGAAVYAAVTKAVDVWLAKLNTRAQRVSAWVQPLLTTLTAAYDKIECRLDDAVEGPLYAAATQLCSAIVSLRDIPSKLEPKMTLPELIEWLSRNSLSGALVPEPVSATAVEMLGWLELALDDAPALVITGLHDGVVPESVNADAFLPNQLRRQLGMMDNARRFARDMYSLQVMLNSRRAVRIIVGKTDANGDPLVPSRLLMACSLADLPSRVLHLVQEDSADTLPLTTRRWQAVSKVSQLEIPRPVDVELPRHITVTAFRDYLKCPYRFYLRHVLKLRSKSDSDLELDASKFGVLVHDTLTLLGEDPVGNSPDAKVVEEFLVGKLHELAIQRFGQNPPATVLVQIEQAEQRLSAFAPIHAERIAAGWQVRFTEQGVDFKDRVMLGNQHPLHLIGRIDRIDFHEATGQWAIWDYKTSETAKNPVTVHWTKRKGWQDLQLPLYRHVAKKLGVTGRPILGYIAIPKQSQGCGFYPAEFSDLQIREADAIANEIADKIGNAEFWPDKLESVDFDDFARICQTQTQRITAAEPIRKLHRFASAEANRVAEDVVYEAQRKLDFPSRSAPKFHPLLIRASAGTGKTFQLSNRLLEIILSGQDVDHILATTFTRKAAGEITARVLQRLAKACIDEDSRQELAKHLQAVDTSAAACLAALRRVTASIHRLRIGTLDSFFAQIARTFSLEMGLPPGWSTMDPVQEPQYKLQAIAKLLNKHDKRTLVELVRMLAKGESARQVAQEILSTVSAGYNVFRITDAGAWDTMPLPTAPSEAAVESALRVLEATKIGNKSAEAQLEKLHLMARSGQWEAVISHGIYANLANDPPTYYRKELPSELVVALELLAEAAAAELLPIRRAQTLASRQVLEAFDRAYTGLTRSNRSMAFADITHYLSQWMRPSEGRALAHNSQMLEFRMDCGVHHLLLDEFQDTSPEQWRILEPIAAPLGGVPSTEKSFFCVGDTKQAIYGWRGGVAEIFDTVAKTVQGMVQQQLQLSYRSSEHIMEAVNDVFEHLDRHANYSGCDPVAKAWSSSFPQHRTTRSNLDGYVRLQNGPKIDKDLSRQEQKSLFLDYTANQIADLVSLSSATIGVLFRTNADVANMIALLRERNVSASQDGGNALTDSAAVELILSLIHLADHPGDSIASFHVRTSPLARVLPYASTEDTAEVSQWFRTQVARRGLGSAIKLVSECLMDRLSWWDQQRLEQLLRSAHAFQSSGITRLSEFEESVMRNRVALPTESQVKVMTIHKSKGLEFDAVFLPELQVDLSSANALLVLRGTDPCQPPTGVLRYMNASLQRMLPPSWQEAFEQHKARGVNESLCMLYVAMTRAKSALYMTVEPKEGQETQDYGSLLQSVLKSETAQASVPESMLYERGNAGWSTALPRVVEEVSSASGMTETEPVRSIELRKDLETAPRRGVSVVAPSLDGSLSEPMLLSQAFSYSQSTGITYGTLVHAFLEQIEWLEDYSLNRRDLRKLAMNRVDADAIQHLPVDFAIDEFEELLELSSVRAALSRSRYKHRHFGIVPSEVHVDNERQVSIMNGDRLISGSIDRLVVLMQDGKPYGAEIFDFKTDAFDPSMTLLWLDDRIDHHRPQLTAYAAAVAEMLDLPITNVATFLVMLSTDDLVRVDARHDSLQGPSQKAMSSERTSSLASESSEL